MRASINIIDKLKYHNILIAMEEIKEIEMKEDIRLKKPVEWTTEHEQILVEWADKAMCYRWLHSKANALFSYLNTWYTIPVIVISTLTGTANFAQDRVPTEYQNYFVMLIGSLNLFAGIVTTIQQFLKITQLNEAHRVSSISWDKFYRNIKIELAKHPKERIDVKHMIKMSKEEFDRLMETSPPIPPKIIESFKTHFQNAEAFAKIIKPEICDILTPTDEFRNQWFSEENQRKLITERNQAQLTDNLKIKAFEEQNKRVFSDFIVTFNNLNNRQPLESEIMDNLKDVVDHETLQLFIRERVADSV